jgi:hypothetical protein
MTQDELIAEIRSAICAGVLTVRIVVDELNRRGYCTTADVPDNERRDFYRRIRKLFELGERVSE